MNYFNPHIRMLKKSISIIIASLFFVNDISYALSPSLGSKIPVTKAGMDAMGKNLFTGKYGPCPIDFEAAEGPDEDICITMPQLERAFTAFKNNKNSKMTYDLFAPKAPHGGAYIVAAGLEIALSEIRERRFSDRYIERLRNTKKFSEEFLKYLSDFIFEGDIDAVPEGTVLFAGMPIIRIRASETEIALLEGLIKNRMNLATNIATKTARIVQAANEEFVNAKGPKRQRGIADFGLRRAQGKAAYLASRSAIIGGAVSTSNMRAAALYGLKMTGTMAHLYVQTYPPKDEIEAFRSYARAFPDSSVFLIDTYDTIEGAKKAAIVAKEMETSGHRLIGVRLDSGELAELSRQVRGILDRAGLSYVKIFASESLDEDRITDIISRGAMIDFFGVGTNLITGGNQPSFELELRPSYGNNLFRVVDDSGKISKYIETPRGFRTLNVLPGQKIEELLMPYWRGGKRVREAVGAAEARERAIGDLKVLPPEAKRLKDAVNIKVEKQVIVNLETDALVVVDAQPTFMPGGGLPVTDGDKIMPNVRRLMNLFPKKNRFATRDQHSKGHISLASSYIGSMTVLTYDMVKDWTESDNRISPEAKFTLTDLKEYLKKIEVQILWPDHGIEGTEEDKLHPDIQESEFEEVVIKGTDPRVDSYSGFFDNAGRPTGLAEKIRVQGFKRVFFVGLAMDYCVGWSAEGGCQEGFEAIVIDDATRPVCFPEGSVEKMYNSFMEKGISLVPETDSIILAGGNTETIKPADLLKDAAHPVFTDKEERTALTEDMYHLTMGQALFMNGRHEKQATFDYFYRVSPYGRNNIIVAGFKHFIEELRRFRFTKENIEYLRSMGIFSEDYLQYLKNFEFHGNIDALEEGSVAFPREPIMRVRGTVFEAMIIESFILNIMNFSSLEATWAEETKKLSPGTRFVEDGLSGAQGRSHLEASYAAHLGGIDATTNFGASELFDIPLAETDDEGEWLGADIVTGGPVSALGGVYKLAVFDSQIRVKLSNDPAKTSLIGDKMIFEIVDANGNVVRRIIALENERFALKAGERVIPRLKPLVRSGRAIHSFPTTEERRAFRAEDVYRYKEIKSAEISKGLAHAQSEFIASITAKNYDRSEPTFANINIMGPGNLSCRFDLGNDLKAEFDQYNNLDENFTDWKNFKSYISNLKARGITKVYLTSPNTDPLLYKYLVELAAYLKQEGFYVGLRTNGLLAKEKIDIINKFDSVSYTLLTLSTDTLEKISTGNRHIIDWDYILTNTTAKKKVSIIVTRENADEVLSLIKFLSKYDNLSYIQVRKVSTATREGLLKEDMCAFEELYAKVSGMYPKAGEFELAPIFQIDGKEVIFWRTEATAVNSWNYFTNGVYSDSHFVIEGYLENRNKAIVSELHTKARLDIFNGYRGRFPVPDDKVDWGIAYPEYSPIYCVMPEVLHADSTKVQRGYADPEDISLAKLPERSYEGDILIKDGFPLNPKGRTGMTGRGALGKWGPNYAVDPLITRLNEETGQYEALVVEKEGSDKLAIPGAMLLKGESSFDAIRRRLGVKMGQDIPMDGAVRLYKGYVDDPRNTDNAWLETEVYHLNLPYELTERLLLQNRLGTWAKWMPLTDENVAEMYANHGEFVRLAMIRLQPDVTRPDKFRNVRDTLKVLLDPNKPVLAVFDTHGVLLKATWEAEFRQLYLELMDNPPTDEWMERHVFNKLNEESIQALSELSGKSKSLIKKQLHDIRLKMREKDIPGAISGALDFVKALKRAGIPMVIMSGTKKELVVRQLKNRGFLDYIDEDNIIGGQRTVSDKFDRGKVLKEIQALYPHYQIILFDDWVEGISAVKEVGGISIGMGYGKGVERAVNQQRLLQGGVDAILDGWNHWQIVYQVLAEHNRVVLQTKRFGHKTARTQAPQEYGKRFHVPDHKVAWEIKYPGYRPRNVVSQVILNNDYSQNLGGRWADPQDFKIVLKDIAEGAREPITSYEGTIKFDNKTGMPLNPRGRTGIKGRGVLGKYGTNNAADPIITRINPRTGEYEVLLVRRKDNGIPAFPGGFLGRIVNIGKASLENTLDAAVRELKEETGIVLTKDDIEKAVSVYKGYADDWRNTDNAWVETEAWHFHIEDLYRAMSMVPCVSDDAKEARWVSVENVAIFEQNPSHAMILSMVKQRLEREHATSRNKLRVAIAQINCIMGDMQGNKQKILDYIKRAKEADADLVVFPELAITGYAPEDLVYKESFIRDNLRTLRSIIEKVHGITVIIGFIDADDDGNLYSAAAVISDGKLKGVYRKRDLPNYGIFDEKRYFKSGKTDEIYDLGGVPFGINICEDIWTDEDGVYLKQTEKGARVLFNISASPYYAGKLKIREDLLSKRVMQTVAFIVYTNLVGGQDEVIYDGGSFIMGPNGKVVAQAARLEEDLVIADLDLTQTGEYKPKGIKATHIERPNAAKPKKPIEPRIIKDQPNELETIYNALVLGTRDYLKKNGFTKAVIGISGGIDSAIVAAIAVDAIGSENVLGISMPSRYNSRETQSDARKLAEALGIKFMERPIESLYSLYLEELRRDEQFASKPQGVTEENIQARIRGNILMAYSNKFGHIVLNTSNKSESAVGYGTLYGDMAGGFAPIQDVYKTMVFQLARFVNSSGKERIPQSIIARPPSAELRENQKDTDSLPPYEILDPILQAYLERNESIAKMSTRWDRATVEKVVRKVDGNEYKRRQASPGIKITERNLGKDWRLPITNRHKENLPIDESSLSAVQEIKLTDDEKLAIHETVNLFCAERIKILSPQSMDLTTSVKETIERIKRINGEKNFSYKPYTEENLRTCLENKEKGEKLIIITTTAFSKFIKGILDKNPSLFKDVRILTIDMPSTYSNENEKTQYQARVIIIAILARLFKKDANPLVGNFLRIMLLNYFSGNIEKVKEFMDNLGVTEKEASAEQIAKRVLYFLEKIVRFTEILEKEQKIMDEFLTYA